MEGSRHGGKYSRNYAKFGLFSELLQTKAASCQSVDDRAMVECGLIRFNQSSCMENHLLECFLSTNPVSPLIVRGLVNRIQRVVSYLVMR